jgi:hypothetical protein
VPPGIVSSEGHREAGTASVELIAALPLLLLAILVAAQLGAVGESLWSAAIGARAGARAALVGRDPAATARRALPPSLRPGARVEGADRVAVRVRAPRLLPLLPQLAVDAESGLGGG